LIISQDSTKQALLRRKRIHGMIQESTSENHEQGITHSIWENSRKFKSKLSQSTSLNLCYCIIKRGEKEGGKKKHHPPL